MGGTGQATGCRTDISGTHLFPAPLCSVTDWGQCIKQCELRLQCRGSATCVAWASPVSGAGLGGRGEITLEWHPAWHPAPYPVPRS